MPSYDESRKLPPVTDEEMKRAFPHLSEKREAKPHFDRDQAVLPLVDKPEDYHPNPEGRRR